MVRQQTWQELQNSDQFVVVGLQIWESRFSEPFAGQSMP
jgi:hypothetical protein